MSESNLEQSPRSERRVVSRLLSDGSVVLAIITAILFLMGWFYQEAYFGFFGLDVITLDLPFYVFLIGSRSPVMELFVILINVIGPLSLIGIATIIFLMIRRDFSVRSLPA